MNETRSLTRLVTPTSLLVEGTPGTRGLREPDHPLYVYFVSEVTDVTHYW